MRRVLSYGYLGAAWLMVTSVLAAILVAGMALFVRNSFWEIHLEFGWGSQLLVLLLIVLGLLRWIPRRLASWLVAVLVLHFLQTLLPGLQEDLPYLAALHPLNASVLTYVAYRHAKRAHELLLEKPVANQQVPELHSPVEI